MSRPVAAVLLALTGATAAFLAAVMVLAALAPVADGELRAQACTGEGAHQAWRAPFNQPYTVSQRGFGVHPHPINGQARPHTGQDLVSEPSPGPVVAVAGGTITFAGSMGGYGTTVDIDHGGGVLTRYAHLASLYPAITQHAGVSAGQQLGIEGSTGQSTGPHLHLEVRVDDVPVDPIAYFADRGAPLDGTPPAAAPPVSAALGPAPPEDVLAGTVGDPTPEGDAPRGGPPEGGVGFELPPPGPDRLASLTNPPTPIPEPMRRLYVDAARRYQLPWTLLAGIGMAETDHGRITATSAAGAQGPMQFIASTWAQMGVDGDGDGRADITNPADSVHAAANYLTKSGVGDGPTGVRQALLAYNRADWYVDDVLHYAAAYGGGTVLGADVDCPDPTRTDLPPLTDDRTRSVLTWATGQAGKPYVFGASGPDAWDCSSFTRAAYATIGISLPRTAAAQRDWAAASNATRVQPGSERPGDLMFWDSYRGPNQVGHVAIVLDPSARTSIQAQSTRTGVGIFTYPHPDQKSLFEIWRVANVS